MKVKWGTKKTDIKTYHPVLGCLISGEVFELKDETAKKYIKSGLLTEEKNIKKKGGK